MRIQPIFIIIILLALCIGFQGIAHAQTAYTQLPLTTLNKWLYNDPQGVASDSNNNVFIAETNNNTVEKIPCSLKGSGGPAYRNITYLDFGTPITLGSGFNHPCGIAVDSASGNVYVADSGNNAVKEIPCSNGNYGTPITLYSGFNNPEGVAVDSYGNVYVANTGNNSVEEIPYSNGNYGTPITLYSEFSNPCGISVNSTSRDVYVANTGNGSVEEIPFSNGNYGIPITLFTGIIQPWGVAVDQYGNVFIADLENVVEMPLYNGTYGSSILVDSAVNTPMGVAVNSNEMVFIADTGSNSVKYVQLPNGLGIFGIPYTLESGEFTQPQGIAVNSTSGDVYVADTRNNSVKEIPFNNGSYGTPITLAGGFYWPEGVAVDSYGNVYVADTWNGAVKKILPDGSILTLGSGFASPEGIAVDSYGNVYVACYSNNSVEEIPYSNGTYGTPITLASGSDTLLFGPVGVAVDSLGNVYVEDIWSLVEIPYSNGNYSTPIPMYFGSGYGVAVDSGGNLYVAGYNNSVNVIPFNNGTYGYSIALDCGSNSGFENSLGVAVDSHDDLFVLFNNGIGEFAPVNLSQSPSGSPTPTPTVTPTPTPGSSSVENLNTNQYYYTIQSAIDSANNGDTILVGSGTYNENIEINKPLSIIGQDTGSGLPVVVHPDPTDNSAVIQIDAAGVYIQGINVTNGYTGFNIVNNNTTISNCAAYSCSGYGFNLGWYLNNITIDNCTTNNNTYDGLGGWYVDNLKITNCYFADSFFLDYSNNSIFNNITANCNVNGGMYSGIFMSNVNNSTIASLNSSNNFIGLDLEYSCFNNISSLELNSNEWQGWYTYESSNNNITNCNITNNGGCGVQLFNSSNNVFWLNTLQGNGQTAYCENASNSWNSTTPLRYSYGGQTYTNYLGNYWGDYSGMDANGDGIGDSLYQIDANNIDYYPMVLSSPVSILAASFTANVTSGTAPLTMQFYDTSSGGPTSWQWNFGDGSANSTEQNVQHTFNNNGTYEVTLTVSNSASSSTISNNITVGVPTSGNLTVAGSTIAGRYVEELALMYDAKNNYQTNTQVSLVGSGPGITATIQGSTDIGMSSRNLTVSETAQGLITYKICDEGIAIIVNNANPISNLSTSQIRDIFAGNVTNWNQIGGSDSPITVVEREAGSGTRDSFETLVMSNKKVNVTSSAVVQTGDGAVLAYLSADPNAIGYVSFSDLMSSVNTTQVKPLQVNGVAPSVSTIKDKSYPLQMPFLLLTKGQPTPLAQAFIDYVLGPEGQAYLASNGLVTLSANSGLSAKFSANTTTGSAPLTVQFTDASTGNGITAWQWSFGDGTPISTEQNPVHTYVSGGTYDVTLTVSNDAGSSTNISTGYVTVLNASGSLLVATDATWPPFESYNTSGGLEGFDIDLMDQIGSKLNMSVSYTNVSFDTIIPLVANGTYQCSISAFIITPERQQVVNFSDPYFHDVMTGEDLGIVVNKANPDLLAAINGALAGMRADGTYQAIYDKWFPQDNHTSYALSLKKGWNLVSSPLVVDPAINVSAFKGTNVTMVAKFNKTTGGFDIYRVGKTPTPFPFAESQGYFLYCSNDTTYQVNGLVEIGQSATIGQGWNMIGWTNMTSTTSKVLAQGLHNVTMLARYNTTSGSYDIYRVGKTPTPFAIQAGEGYFLYTTYAGQQTLAMG